MKVTVTESVSVDGVMQGLGGPDEDRRGGFERADGPSRSWGIGRGRRLCALQLPE